MELAFLFKGLILGFSVAAPVGPIGVLCINRTIDKSYFSGLVSGLGAATADLIYGLIAGFGLTIISNFLIAQKLWMQIFGLLFLFYVGIKTLFQKPQFESNKVGNKSLVKDYITTFLLTITNPMTVLFFLAVFAGLGLSNAENIKLAPILLVTGVFVGSGIWWLFLSSLTYKLKNKIGNGIIKQINLISGITILMFAIMILYDLIKDII